MKAKRSLEQFRLPAPLALRLEKEKQKSGRTKTKIVEMALIHFFSIKTA